MPIRAVIFDLDGTITQPYFDFGAIREEIGLSRDGEPILEAMEKMTPEQRRRLAGLQERGIPVGILTRNQKSNVQAVADKHGLRFDAVVGREDGPVKPDVFGVLHLCRSFAVAPAEAMVVGDYLFDLLCARAAGAIPVLLANHERADEFARHADFTVDRLEELLPLVDRYNGTKEPITENRMPDV
jgi:phosphoglycolate phosphatase-like HAD superfamily hydrolase